MQLVPRDLLNTPTNALLAMERDPFVSNAEWRVIVAELAKRTGPASQSITLNTINVASVQPSRRSPVPMALGIGGACLLVIGSFAPLVSVPILGSLNYFANGHGDGVFAIALALVAAVLASFRRYRWLGLLGAAAVGLLIIAFSRFSSAMSEAARAAQEQQAAGNPFAGLSEMFVSRVQVEWGLAVLVIGAGFLIGASFAGWKSE